MTHPSHSSCWHCGEPIPPNVELTAHIQGVDRPMCCHGCQMVANLIHESGLERYYDFRDALPNRPNQNPVSGDDFVAWDREAVLQHHAKSDCDGLYRIHLVLENVHCSACAWLIQRFIKPLPGVVDIAVDTADGRATLTWSPQKTPLSQVALRLAQLGYVPHLDSPDASISRNQQDRRAMLKYIVVAGLGMMQVMSYALAGYIGAFQDLDAQDARFFQVISMLVAVPVALYSGQMFYVGAWNALKQRTLGMDVPVAAAMLIALTASILITFLGEGETYFDSVVMFIFFLLLGRYAVMVARQNAGQLHSALARALPNQITRVSTEGIEKVALIELNAGDWVQVGLGETVPADGCIIEGQGLLDESLLSGESKLALRKTGDPVLAGTQLQQGQVVIEIERLGQNTTLSDIVSLLDQARHFRPHSARLADQIAGWFIAFVLLGSLSAGAIWWTIDPNAALPIMLSILVVSCPCALALGTPVALASSARGFAQLGILMIRPDVIEALPKVTHVVLDKTGTLTDAKMAVSEVLDTTGQPLDNPAAMLTLAARLERISRHPVASAFAKHDDGYSVINSQEQLHEGVSGQIDGQMHFLGKPQMISGVINKPLTAPSTGQWIALSTDQKLLAWFKLENPLRSGAQNLVTGLKQKGLSVWLASGDRQANVEAIAKQLGIEHFRGQCSPTDKLTLIQSLQKQGHRVTMIGDGINDAPVLAGADVSMTLAEGADIAKTQADMVITGSDLNNVDQAFRLAPKVRQVIAQNLAWAIGYNLFAFPLAAFGLVPPWAAAIGMSASSLLVVLNGRRAGRGLAQMKTQSNTDIGLIQDSEDRSTPLPHPRSA